MNIYSVATSLTLVCYVWLMYLFLRSGWRRNRPNQYFTLYLLTMIVWQLAYFKLAISTTPGSAMTAYLIVSSVLSAQFVIYYAFARAFLHLRSGRLMLRLGVLVWLATTLAAIFRPDLLYTSIQRDPRMGLYVPTYHPLIFLFVGSNYFFLLYAAYNLYREYHASRSDLQRSRVQYLLLGLGFVVAGTLANLIHSLQPYPIDVAANVVNAMLITYAILRYQLMDIRLVIRLGLLYLIPTAIIATGYFLIVFLAMPFFQIVTGYQVLLSLIMAAITAVAVQPLREKVQAVVDRYFFREKYDAGQMLKRLSETAASILDLDRLTTMILDAVFPVMHIEKAAFLIKHANSDEYRLMASRGLQPRTEFTLQANHPVIEWLAAHRRALLKREVDVIPQFRSLWGQERVELERMGAELFIPLLAKDGLIGVLVLGRKLSEQAYSQDDQTTLMTLANQTAVAMENARLYEETQRRLQESEMLNRVRASIISALELDKVLQVIIDSAVQAVPSSQRGALHLWDEEARRLLIGASSGFATAPACMESLSPGEGCPGRAFEHRQPVIVDNAEQDYRVAAALPTDARSVVSIPLVVKGRGIGTITLESVTEYGAFNRDDLALLSAFADQAAIAIDNATLYQAEQRELQQRKRAEQQLQELNATLEQRVQQRTFELQVLYELSQKISYCVDPGELFGALLTDLQRAVPYDVSASIAVMDDWCQWYIRPARVLLPHVEQEVTARLAASARREGHEALCLPEIRRLDYESPSPDAPPVAALASILEVPLLAGERGAAAGTLLVASEKPDAFNEDHRRLLLTLASQASVAIQRLRALIEGEQRRQENLVERLPEGVILLDAQHRIILANPVGQEYLATLAKVGVGDVLHKLDSLDVATLLEDAPQGEPHREVSLVDSGARSFEILSRPINTGHLESGWVLVVRDVSERKRAEEEKAKLEAQLRQAQKMEAVGLLAGGVAHEFNNMLTVIQGNTELAMLQGSPDLPQRELAIIQRTAQKAARLTQSLLAFSRRQVLQRKDVHLNHLVKSLAEMLARLIGEHISLDLKLQPDIGAVHVDEQAVEQALMNLALNARDAMPSGGTLRFETAQLEIDAAFCQTHSEARPGEYIRVSVVDNGVGMDEATRAHLFEPFFTTKEVGKGTGLGLAMVYGIVKQHGGWIDVESHKGEGTRFDVYLPVQSTTVQPERAEDLVQRIPSGNETILLAEDEQDVRDLARRTLEMLGYEILTAVDGEDATQVFASNKDRIQLVILDVVMPRMSGPRAYQAMSAIRPDLPVLYISGYSADAASADPNVSIAKNMLQKPFAVEGLGRKVRQLLDASRLALREGQEQQNG